MDLGEELSQEHERIRYDPHYSHDMLASAVPDSTTANAAVVGSTVAHRNSRDVELPGMNFSSQQQQHATTSVCMSPSCSSRTDDSRHERKVGLESTGLREMMAHANDIPTNAAPTPTLGVAQRLMLTRSSLGPVNSSELTVSLPNISSLPSPQHSIVRPPLPSPSLTALNSLSGDIPDGASSPLSMAAESTSSSVWQSRPMSLHSSSAAFLSTGFPRDSDTLAYRLLGPHLFYQAGWGRRLRISYEKLSMAAQLIAAPLGILAVIDVVPSWVIYATFPLLVVHAVVLVLILNLKLARLVFFSFESCFLFANVAAFAIDFAVLTNDTAKAVFSLQIFYSLLCTILDESLPIPAIMQISGPLFFSTFAIVFLMLVITGTYTFPETKYIYLYSPAQMTFDLRDFLINRILIIILFFIKNSLTRILYPKTYNVLCARVKSPLYPDINHGQHRVYLFGEQRRISHSERNHVNADGLNTILSVGAAADSQQTFKNMKENKEERKRKSTNSQKTSKVAHHEELEQVEVDEKKRNNYSERQEQTASLQLTNYVEKPAAQFPPSIKTEVEDVPVPSSIHASSTGDLEIAPAAATPAAASASSVISTSVINFSAQSSAPVRSSTAFAPVYWIPTPMTLHSSGLKFLTTRFPHDCHCLAWKLLNGERRQWAFYLLTTFAPYVTSILLFYSLFVSTFIWLDFSIAGNGASWSCLILIVHIIVLVSTINYRLAAHVLFSFETVFVFAQVVSLMISGVYLTGNDIRAIQIILWGYAYFVVALYDCLPISHGRKSINSVILFLGTFVLITLIYLNLTIFATPTAVTVFTYGGANITIDIRDFFVNRLLTIFLYLGKDVLARLLYPRTFCNLKVKIMTSCIADENK